MPNMKDGADYASGDRGSYQQMNREKNNFRGAASPTSIQPGMIFSRSSDDALFHHQTALDKRIIQETDIMLFAEALLASSSVDMNPGAPPAMTVLYTVPAGKSCIITKVIIRNSSGNLTTASISFGFNSNGNDVMPDSTRTYIDGSTKYALILPANGAVQGFAAGTFKCAVNTAQGAVMTITADVFGYLY